MDGLCGVYRVILCFVFVLGSVAGGSVSTCTLVNRTPALDTCLTQQDGADAACSKPTMVTSVTDCLTDIKAAFMDADTFWFGNNYTVNCPQGPAAGVVECANRNPQKADSIGTRTFPTGPVFDNIDRYLRVVYTSTPGEYSGCGNTYKFTEEWTKEIDPLTPDPVRPWDARHLPDLKWKYTIGDFYTILIYDVGFDNIHGVYINIDGNNMVTAQTVKPYSGPLIMTTQHNPYLFMILKQTAGMLEMPEKWTNAITNQSAQFVISDMMAELNMTGPLAVNWVVATGDPYSIGLMLNMQLINMCPNLVAQAMDNMTRPFLPRPASLDIWINVTFSPDAMSYTACCTDYTYPARSFSLNPFGEYLHKSAEVRSNATLEISFLKKGYYEQASNFTDDLYTLVALDPDVPFPNVGTESRPLIHYLVINIPDGDVTQGDVIQPYSGPAPPDKTHVYYFLLYKQPSILLTSAVGQFSGANCTGRHVGRCLYDINRAVSEQNLTLVGASWMESDRDDYVIYRNLYRGQAEKDECPGQPGYADPCPIQGAPRSIVSVLLVIMSACIALF